ncbi:hypothetical protein ACFX2I_039042 [Malus domestica]
MIDFHGAKPAHRHEEADREDEDGAEGDPYETGDDDDRGEDDWAEDDGGEGKTDEEEENDAGEDNLEIEVLLALKGPAKEDVEYLILTEPVMAYTAMAICCCRNLH